MALFHCVIIHVNVHFDQTETSVFVLVGSNNSSLSYWLLLFLNLLKTIQVTVLTASFELRLQYL